MIYSKPPGMPLAQRIVDDHKDKLLAQHKEALHEPTIAQLKAQLAAARVRIAELEEAFLQPSVFYRKLVKVLPITSSEAKVLELLYANEHPLKCKSITKALFPQSADHTVFVHICRLRKKLAPSNIAITTTKLGYCLPPESRQIVERLLAQ